jgi:hypothetical protein
MEGEGEGEGEGGREGEGRGWGWGGAGIELETYSCHRNICWGRGSGINKNFSFKNQVKILFKS